MRGSVPSRPSFHAAFACARCALVALALVLAFAAGCGGSKSGSDASNGSSSASPPAPAPAPAETAATPPANAGGTSASPATAADLGAKVFATRCALCHGPTGHGDGPGAKALKPQPRNFHDTAYMNSRTDAQLLETIHKGKGPMPRWQGVLTEAEMTAVLAHIRALGKTP